MSYAPGSQDSSVLCESKLPSVLCTGESQNLTYWKSKIVLSTYWGVETPRCPRYLLGSRFLFLWTFKPMLQPLKQHSFKKLFSFSFTIQIKFKHILKFFLTEGFWGDSPVSQAPGSHFKRLITQPRSKKSKCPEDISNGTRRSCLGKKTEYKKSRETVPLSTQQRYFANGYCNSWFFLANKNTEKPR